MWMRKALRQEVVQEVSHLLQAYLDEFVFRFNRRNSRSRGLLFDTLIKQAIHTKPLLYKQMINVS